MPENVQQHLSIKTTRFFMKLIGMWYTTNDREKLVSNILLSCGVFNMACALTVILMDLFYSWGDLKAVSYNAPCTTSTLQEFMKLAVFVYYRTEILNFNRYTDVTFWRVKYDREDQDILAKCNKTCIWAYVTSFLLMQTITWYYMSIPVIENLGRNETSRELPFPLWFDLPFAQTPWYEAAFALEAVATCYVGISSTAFAVFFFTVNLYTVGQFKILQRKLKNPSTVDDASKYSHNELLVYYEKTSEYITAFDYLKECVKQHQLLIAYVERVEYFFCYIVMGQALGGVLQICFSSFQIVLGAEVSPQRIGLSAIFLVGSTIQLYLFSWSSHMIIEESFGVAGAAYKSPWYDMPLLPNNKGYRFTVLMLICRAQKPCILSVGKFSALSLQTFASVFNTSISYFTVLRQMRDKT